MRAILLDWIMVICEEMGLKIETYHISICCLDTYLNKT